MRGRARSGGVPWPPNGPRHLGPGSPGRWRNELGNGPKNRGDRRDRIGWSNGRSGDFRTSGPGPKSKKRPDRVVSGSWAVKVSRVAGGMAPRKTDRRRGRIGPGFRAPEVVRNPRKVPIRLLRFWRLWVGSEPSQILPTSGRIAACRITTDDTPVHRIVGPVGFRSWKTRRGPRVDGPGPGSRPALSQRRRSGAWRSPWRIFPGFGLQVACGPCSLPGSRAAFRLRSSRSEPQTNSGSPVPRGQR